MFKCTARERLTALRERVENGERFPKKTGSVTEHIHTTYSFSPYTPAAAAYMAAMAGNSEAGIVDHDTAAGAYEFSEACRILGMKARIGLECRVSMAGTPFENRRTNNPDQPGISYMVLHGLTLGTAAELTEYFAPYREKRLERGRKMTERINRLLPECRLDFIRDVLPLSMYEHGGTVTERHILFALSKRLIEMYGRGAALAEPLRRLGAALCGKQLERISDTDSEFYCHDVMHILKSAVSERIYLPAAEECISFSELCEISKKYGVLCCYAYLGDVRDGTAGDKRAMRFEDAYLEELLEFLKHSGVGAVTHSGSRNTAEQMQRLLRLCGQYGLLTIDGEDINSPRQSFCCKTARSGNIIK